ncbi:hypothetical protein TNCT_562831 [Trichonephila clavata]|uniref:Uncharacterized protein n=1 Tax=Trichonephila clavata TaxID=2740835 RepID=A0A8X6FJC3_TRICU|nr:hypothetical protein TNCT_562831 [Trichonephila clavata]
MNMLAFDSKYIIADFQTVAMIRLEVSVLVLSVIAVSSVIAYKGYDFDFMEFNKDTDMCVNKARDQGLCDDYTDCKMKLPEPVM